MELTLYRKRSLSRTFVHKSDILEQFIRARRSTKEYRPKFRRGFLGNGPRFHAHRLVDLRYDSRTVKMQSAFAR